MNINLTWSYSVLFSLNATTTKILINKKGNRFNARARKCCKISFANFVITIFTLNASASRIKPLKVKFIMPLNQLIYKRQPAAVHSPVQCNLYCNTQRRVSRECTT